MNWLKVEVTVSNEAAEAISSAMINISPSGIQVETSNEATTLIIYVPESVSAEDTESQLKDALEKIKSQGLKVAPASIAISPVTDIDWVENYKKFFKPIRIGRIFIIPSWEEVSPLPDEIVIKLDPGLAFGTGSHPTTEGCLIFLQGLICGGETVLDLGTGSGILAIAAAKLGAGRVIAIDNDLQAIEVARENAAKNSVSNRTEFAILDFADFKPAHVDLVAANLTAPLITKFLPAIAQKLEDLKTIIASGITTEQKDAVLLALKENGFNVEKVLDIGEWTTLVGRLG